jgi:hypothetical protein
MAITLESAARDLQGAPRGERIGAMRDFVAALPEEQKKELQQELSATLPAPDTVTNNKIWIVVIWGFVIALIGSLALMGTSMFFVPAQGGTKPETLLTVFTTVSAFLIGLFVPTPATKK